MFIEDDAVNTMVLDGVEEELAAHKNVSEVVSLASPVETRLNEQEGVNTRQGELVSHKRRKEVYAARTYLQLVQRLAGRNGLQCKVYRVRSE